MTQAEFIFPEDLEDEPTLKPIEFSRDEERRAGQLAGAHGLAAGAAAGDEGEAHLQARRRDARSDAHPQPSAEGYFVAERGLAFDWIERIRIAGTWSEAVERGWDETVNSLGMVYRFLGKLGAQVSVTSLGGPITIAQAAGFSAVRRARASCWCSSRCSAPTWR